MIALFDPRGIPTGDYKQRYPELGRIDEYRSLSSIQLVFVWWFANPTSPLLQKPISEEERSEEALKRCGLYNALSKEDRIRYISLRFPEAVNTAIQHTLKLRPDIRQEANELLENVFKNYKDLSNINKFKDAEGGVDYSAYITTATKASANLPGLIKQIEEGYGITTVSADMEDESEAANHMLRNYADTKRTGQ